MGALSFKHKMSSTMCCELFSLIPFLPLCVQIFRAGEKILDRQRYQFPSNWVYVDHVEGEWGAFNEIMKRKDGAVQSQVCGGRS